MNKYALMLSIFFFGLAGFLAPPASAMINADAIELFSSCDIDYDNVLSNEEAFSCGMPEDEVVNYDFNGDGMIDSSEFTLWYTDAS